MSTARPAMEHHRDLSRRFGAYRWQLVAILWVVGLLNYADRQAIFSVFPLLQLRLHLNLAQLGLIGSAFAWVYGAIGPIAGYVVDRIRRKTAIIAGLQSWSWICAATALAGNVWSLIAVRCAMGLGESLYFPASLSMLSDYHGGETRSRALSLHQTSVYAGTIAGGFCAGWIADRFDWRWPFVCFGAAGVAFSLMLMRFLVEPARGAGEHSGIPSGRESKPMTFSKFIAFAMGEPLVWLMMLAFVCANFVAVVLLVWMPTYLYRAFHLNLAMSGLSATLFAQAGSIAGSILGGWIADRWARRIKSGRILVQIVGVFFGAPFVFLCCESHSMGLVFAMLTAWGFFKGLYDANLFASLFDAVPAESRGVAAGWMNTLGWIGGGGLAPVAVGVAAGKFGLGAAMSMVSVVYIFAAVFLATAALILQRRASSRHPDQSWARKSSS